MTDNVRDSSNSGDRGSGDGLRSETTTMLLNSLNGSDSQPAEELYRRIYDDLQRRAAHVFHQLKVGQTLQPSDLIAEAFLRLVDQTRARYEGRRHFLNIAAEIMRRVLLDYARKKGALKRPPDRKRVPLENARVLVKSDSIDILALEEALEKLKTIDERKVRVAELRFFAGLTIKETADVLGVAPKTVELDWCAARAWLQVELERENHDVS